MTVVRQSEEFAAWLEALDRSERRGVNRVVALLEIHGVTLGDPHSSALRGSRIPLRELRPRSGASPLRVLYAFDPHRDAVIPLGGNKAAGPRFYRRAIARAEILWTEHLTSLALEDRS